MSNPHLSSSTPFVYPAVNITLPDHFNGDADFDRWLVHFEMICEINHWEGRTKANYLCGALRGDALDAIQGLTTRERNHFGVLVQKLRDEVTIKQSVQAYRLQCRRRKRKEKESLLSLSKDIRRLAIKAFPNAPLDVVEDFAVDHFVEALGDATLRIQIRRNKPRNLTDAVTIAQFEEGLLKVDEDRNPLGRRLASIRPTEFDTQTTPDKPLDIGSPTRSNDRPNERPKEAPKTRPTDRPEENSRDEFNQWKNEIDSKMNTLYNITKDLRDRFPTSETNDKSVRFGPNVKANTDYARPTSRRSSGYGYRPNNGECYYCHQYGHFRRECPLLQRRPNPGYQNRSYVNPAYNRPPVSPFQPVQNGPPMSMQGNVMPRPQGPTPTYNAPVTTVPNSSAPRPDRPMGNYGTYQQGGSNVALNW
jgi:hypothetical protein